MALEGQTINQFWLATCERRPERTLSPGSLKAQLHSQHAATLQPGPGRVTAELQRRHEHSEPIYTEVEHVCRQLERVRVV